MEDIEAIRDFAVQENIDFAVVAPDDPLVMGAVDLLNEAGIKVLHINNAMAMTDLENNALFVEKTEESLRTLYKFRNDLRGYSHILSIVERLRAFHLLSCARHLFCFAANGMRVNLTGSHPRLPLFNWYKLGYYIAYEHSQQTAGNV